MVKILKAAKKTIQKNIATAKIYLITLSITFSFIALIDYQFYQSFFIIKKTDKNIVIVALPKSGSTYLSMTLQENLNYIRLFKPNDPRGKIMPAITYANNNKSVYLRGSAGEFRDFFSKNSLINRDHYRAPSKILNKKFGSPMLNIDILRKNANKMVLHLRDPRQALLSYVHHLNNNEGDHFALPDLTNQHDDLSEYYKMDLGGKIDWAIENILPHMIVWINDWLDFKQKEDQNKNGLKILLTTYDELIQNEMKLFKKITNFYGLSLDEAHFKKLTKNAGLRFRKGDPEEWRSVFTKAQKEKVAKIVPKTLLQQFNWQP